MDMKKIYLTLLLLNFSFTFYAQEIGRNIVPNTISIKKVEDQMNRNSNLSFLAPSEQNSVVALSTSPTGNSTDPTNTKGNLSVSPTGGSLYSIPIACPPGINGVVPKMELSYNSQSGNGAAGYGWNIGGLSSITRIPSTKYHDGTIDPVDFNALDRFAFDGQRLILKSGVYGAPGSVYETENFSTYKITSYGVHPSGANYGPAYFKVEYPDGSVAYFGNSTDSRSLNDWSITYWENPQGVRISYTYVQSNNIINISSVKYGTKTTTAPINEIQFIYKTRARPEQAYIGGQSFIRNTILSQISSKGNAVGYRNYFLTHESSSLGYERLTSITEKSGDLSKSLNPTVFYYDTTAESIQGSTVTTDLSVGNITSSNAATVSGDFNGDGFMDFIIYPTTGADTKKKYWVFAGVNSGSTLDIGFQHNSGLFDEIFSVNYINYNNKLMPLQGWTTVQGGVFTTYALAAYGIVQQDQKSYTFPKHTYYSEHPLSCISTRPPIIHVEDIAKTFLSGDFNGDGLTDLVAVERNFTYSYLGPCDINDQPLNVTDTYYGATYFINLDRRITSNFVNTAGYINALSTSKLLIADFNGDGKSDIYVFDSGKVKIYGLNSSNQFTLLFTNTAADTNIALDKPILMGDYNGDGKTDFIIPKTTGSAEWYKYSSTGTNLVKETQTYFSFPANSSTTSYSVIPSDYNNDGKTDLLVATSSRGASTGSLTITCYINKNGAFSTLGGNYYSGSIANHPDIYANALPIFLSNQPNKKLELSFLNSNKVFTFNSTKDLNKDQLLRAITIGNGLTEAITYKPLVSSSYQDIGSIYLNSGYTESYPNFDIIELPTFQVVTKLECTGNSLYKKQLFSYYGAVSNIEGLGLLGFRATLKTNWFSDSSSTPIISTVAKNDIALRGANSENYTVLGMASPSAATPSTYITRNTITYDSQLSVNKVFTLQNKSTIQYNGLENTNSETTNIYDSYNNITSSTLKVSEGSSVVQTTTANFTYDNLPSASPYVIGRLTNKLQNTTISGDSSQSEEIYGYTNNLLTQIKKKGNNTDYLTEDNVYDSYGNITQKTISATGLTPRVTNYEYDTSGRFLTKKTDVAGLSTIYIYNADNGTLRFEIKPYGLQSSYYYDVWFKKIKTTDYLSKANNYSYTASTFKTIVTTTGDDGSASEEIFDDLGRKIRSGTKNINGVFSYVSYNYDIYDRNIEKSEPYFGGGASSWSTSVFDSYGRLSSSTSYTGSTVNFSYSGLTSIMTENGKTKTIVKNALGNIVSLTDSPGGTINYTYFANGNLKSSSLDGAITTVEQDGWGRKTKLTDPSAGIFTYEYNSFGETTKESTPNGSTTFVLNNVGKVSQKTVSGVNTNSKTTYTYDSATKLLSTAVFENLNEPGSIITNIYSYDGAKRIQQTVETTPYATFSKNLTYDAFGRIDTETSTAQISGQSSGKTIKYIYKNGFSWQILDNSNSAVLWQTNTVNAKGQISTAQSGPVLITNSFDSYGFPSQIKYDKASAPTTNILTLNTVFDALKGNLTSRSNSLFGWNESFKYDTLDRLTEYTNTSGIQETQLYDDKGRITQNSTGSYNYSNTNKPYQNTSVTVTPAALAYYNARPTLNISYNTFKSPVEIEEAGVDKVSFLYNDSGNRSTMFYGGLQNDKLQRQFRKHYSSDGTMEIKENKTAGTVEFITYIAGDAYSSSIVLKSDGSNQNFLYLQRDYQGSIVAVSDASGAVLEKRLFDAWGKIAKVQNGSGTNLVGLVILDRGYTGHEHLQSIAIINMNGRIYDPQLHRFLQPDNDIQDSFDVQNYNRYSYVLNNPLSYTDPSGENFKQWWSKNWRTVVTVVAAVATAVVIVVSLGTATPLVAAVWAGAGAGLVGGALGTALNGGSIKDIVVNGITGAAFGALSGYLGGVAALYAPVSGAFAGAAYGGTTNAVIASFMNILQGKNWSDGILLSTAIGTVTGGYSGFKAAEGQGLNGWTGTPKNSVITTQAKNVDAAIENVQAAYKESLTSQQQPINMSSASVADGPIEFTTSSTSFAPSRTYTIFDGEGNLFKFGVTDADFNRMNQSLKMAGEGATAKFSTIIPKFQAHINETYLRSLNFNSTGVWKLPGMTYPYPRNFETGVRIRP